MHFTCSSQFKNMLHVQILIQRAGKCRVLLWCHTAFCSATVSVSHNYWFLYTHALYSLFLTVRCFSYVPIIYPCRTSEDDPRKARYFQRGTCQTAEEHTSVNIAIPLVLANDIVGTISMHILCTIVPLNELSQ